MFSQQRRRGHQLPRLAITALRNVKFDPCILKAPAEILLAEPLNGRDRNPFARRKLELAGACRLTIGMNGTGAAHADTAAIFGATQREIIAQYPEQRSFRVSIHLVDGPVYQQPV